MKCPKCGWKYDVDACPLSGWYKCNNDKCGVVFDKEGNVISGKEIITKDKCRPCL